MLKLNTIPIIIHQGEVKVADKYMTKCKDSHVQNLMYARTTKTLQDLLGIGSIGMMKHITAMMKMDLVEAVKEKRTMDLPLKVINPFSAFAVVVLEFGKMSRKIIFESLDKRVDFPMLLPGNKMDTSESSMTEILQYHPKFDWKKEFQRTNSRIFDKNFKFEKTKKSETEKEGKSHDLIEFLADDMSRYYLKAFATLEFSVENLLVYEEVEKFKSLRKSKSYDPIVELEMAKHILNHYLLEGAYMQINIPVKLALTCKEAIEKAEEKKEQDEKFSEIFDDIVTDVRNNCIADTFSRFIVSKYKFEYEAMKKSNNHTVNYFI